MPPELLPLIGRDLYYRENILALGQRLPPDDAVVAEWLEEAVKANDALQFVFILYAAFATGRKVDARHLVGGLPMLPNEQDVMWAGFHMEGDVVAAVLEAVKLGGTAPGREAVGLLVAAEWCLTKGIKPMPPELIVQARLIARKHWKGEGVSRDIHVLAVATGDATLKSMVREKFPKVTPEKFANLEKAVADYRDALRKVADTPLMDLIPESPAPRTRILAKGTTIRRAAARVGRNEPCPCGSGKKYKHCCIEKDEERLHHSSHVAGMTAEEVDQEPEPHLTLPMMSKMATFQFARLDPLKLKPELLAHYSYHLVVRGLYDRFIPTLEKLALREDFDAYDAWYGGVWWGVHQGKAGFVEKLMQMPVYPEKLREEDKRVLFGVNLLLNQHDPFAMLAVLEEQAAKMLDETDEEKLLSFGLWIMRNERLQSVGLLAARGIIALGKEKSASFLMTQILELRDKLNLPPDDPISDLADKHLLRQRHEDEQDDKESAATLRKARRNLEKKAAEVRELKETLAKVQRDLELRERSEKRDGTQPKPTPTAEEKKEAAELRTRVEELKSTLKQTHIERNEFRRDLEQAHAELEQLRAARPKAGEAEAADHEESLLRPPEPAIPQPVRMLEFPKKFDELLHGVPKHIARSTMVTLGQIAGGEPAGFVGARRLNVCEDITRQRIGSDYRLLFRLLPDRVQVVTLINRRDLDRTIKSLV